MTAAETILDVLASDHRAVLELLDQLDAESAAALNGSGTDADVRLREQLVIELVRHFVAEEQYLLPLVRDGLVEGDRLADAALESDRHCEHALRALENPQADAEYLAVALATIRRQVMAHVAGQQDQLFPALDRQVDRNQLIALAEQVLGAEQLAPTRPRLLAASNPALNKFSSLVEGFIDHVRDSYTHRGATEDMVD
ncbi:MAG: hemerythrin domain-containing protein [Jatrophihabitantaceae bacterium]